MTSAASLLRRSKLRFLIKPQVLAFILAMVLVPLLFWLSERTTAKLLESRQWVEHTYNVMSHLERLHSHTEMLESARRGYYITQQEAYLRPYYFAQQHLQEDLTALKKLTVDNPTQQKHLQNVEPTLNTLLDVAKRDIGNKVDTDREAGSMDHAKLAIDQFRSLADDMRAEENRLLTERTATSTNKLRDLKLLMGGMVLCFLLLLFFSFINLMLEVRRRREIERGLVEMQALSDLTVNNLSVMREMTSLLQACSNIEESLEVIRQFALRLLNVEAGVLYLFRESRNQVEASLTWGKPALSEIIFTPDDCWALRKGEAHLFDHARHTIRCKHLPEVANISTLCVPIVAQGNVLGIFYMENHNERDISEPEQQLAESLSSQIALALASIKLRDTLRNLSVRDPLTGLFNRRYMEESLSREIATAQRKNRPLGLTIFDLDYFKKFNDTFGHDAGDLLLREVGALLKNNNRAGDIVCRFGGEEFVVIYPEASAEVVLERVHQLREMILAIQLQHFGRSLGQVSASFGVAMFPDHGGTGEELLRHADHALYKAKAAGRNRVESV